VSARLIPVGVVGFGAIGGEVARALHRGIPGLALAGVALRSEASRRAAAEALGGDVPLGTVEEIAASATVVVDCASAASFVAVAEAVLAPGRTLLTVNAANLLDRMDLVDRAAAQGARIHVASGAILGLDGVRAAAIGGISSATIVTRKHPRSLAGAPYVVARGLDLDGLGEALRIFAGPVREGARAFPENVNVAAALALAGAGPDRTMMEVWADPAVSRNEHTVTVEGATVRFTVRVENVPNPDNPRTGLVTPHSVIDALRALAAPFRVGS